MATLFALAPTRIEFPLDTARGVRARAPNVDAADVITVSFGAVDVRLSVDRSDQVGSDFTLHARSLPSLTHRVILPRRGVDAKIGS